MSKTQIDAPAGVPFVDITREFDAPLELVRRAWTDPDLVKQWLGPRQYEMVIEQWDARAGGAYRYIHRDDAGNEFGFHGVFHSNDPDNMVQTFEFEGMPGHSRSTGFSSRTSVAGVPDPASIRSSSRSRIAMAWCRPGWATASARASSASMSSWRRCRCPSAEGH